jgi:hypothetical protein
MFAVDSTENVAGSPPTAAGDWFSSSARPSSVSQSHGQSGAPLRVLILGASGVGKTALTAQFMTSEYLNTYEASLGKWPLSFSFKRLKIETMDAYEQRPLNGRRLNGPAASLPRRLNADDGCDAHKNQTAP